MKRILVMGCPGAGKAKLAVQLGRITGLDVYHIKDDRFSVKHTDDEKRAWKEAVRRIVDRDSWVIEGTQSISYEMRMERADTVFYIRQKPVNCLKSFIGRSLKKKLAGNRDRMHINLDMLKKIMAYRKTLRPMIEDLIKANESHLNVIFFENDIEINSYIEKLRSEYPAV